MRRCSAEYALGNPRQFKSQLEIFKLTLARLCDNILTDFLGHSFMTSLFPKQPPDLKKTVLRKLNQRPYRPVELLQELQSARISESALKDALAALLDARVIELSPDRRITLRKRETSRAVRKAG
jgi:hypothetical protein